MVSNIFRFLRTWHQKYLQLCAVVSAPAYKIFQAQSTDETLSRWANILTILAFLGFNTFLATLGHSVAIAIVGLISWLVACWLSRIQKIDLLDEHGNKIEEIFKVRNKIAGILLLVIPLFTLLLLLVSVMTGRSKILEAAIIGFECPSRSYEYNHLIAFSFNGRWEFDEFVYDRNSTKKVDWVVIRIVDGTGNELFRTTLGANVDRYETGITASDDTPSVLEPLFYYRISSPVSNPVTMQIYETEEQNDAIDGEMLFSNSSFSDCVDRPFRTEFIDPSLFESMILIYREDFEDGIGMEWSARNTISVPSPLSENRFLGEFTNDEVQLRLDQLPAHVGLRIAFDLYILRSWNGSGSDNDFWSLEVGDLLVFNTTFNNLDFLPDQIQAFPNEHGQQIEHPPRSGAVENDTLDFLYPFPGQQQPTLIPMDAVYRLSFDIVHSGANVVFDFGSLSLEGGVEDESWGLDNVEVYLLN